MWDLVPKERETYMKRLIVNFVIAALFSLGAVIVESGVLNGSQTTAAADSCKPGKGNPSRPSSC